MPDTHNNKMNIVTQRFAPSNTSAVGVLTSASNDLFLRIRSQLKSAQMDSEQQGMRVSVTEEATCIVVVDGSTEDNDERSVHLDSIDISSAKSYIIKYEFFQKNVGMRSFEDKTISSGHLGASGCTKPFVV